MIPDLRMEKEMESILKFFGHWVTSEAKVQKPSLPFSYQNFKPNVATTTCVGKKKIISVNEMIQKSWGVQMLIKYIILFNSPSDFNGF